MTTIEQLHRLSAVRLSPNLWPRWEGEFIRLMEFTIVYCMGRNLRMIEETSLSSGLVSVDFFHEKFTLRGDYEVSA